MKILFMAMVLTFTGCSGNIQIIRSQSKEIEHLHSVIYGLEKSLKWSFDDLRMCREGWPPKADREAK